MFAHIDVSIDAYLRELAECLLPESAVAVAKWLLENGEKRNSTHGEQCRCLLRTNVRSMSTAARLCVSSWQRGWQRLVAEGLAKQVDNFPVVGQSLLVLNLARVVTRAEERRGTVGSIDFDASDPLCSTLTHSDPTLPDSLNSNTSKIPVPCNPVPDSLEDARVTKWERPWARDGGVTDADLVRAVTTTDQSALRALWDAAVALGWIEDCEDNRLRFLTICRHVGTTTGLQSRRAVLMDRTKGSRRYTPLDVTRIPHACEEWARNALNRRRRAEFTNEPRG